MNPKNIVALTDSQEAGRIVYWRLSGEVDAGTFAFAIADRFPGNPPILTAPGAPSEDTALRRACRSLASKTTVITTRAAGGFAILDKHDDTQAGGHVSFSESLTVAVRADDGVITCDPPDHAMADQIRAAYKDASEKLDAQDISLWLSRTVMRVLGAVSLREAGGVYFIPRSKLALWVRIVDAIRSCTAHRIFEIPAMTSSEACEAILDAVETEAQQEIDRMSAELTGADLGKRAILTRLGTCEAIERKVSGYEGLLGTKLESLRERLLELRSSITLAAAQASADLTAVPTIDLGF